MDGEIRSQFKTICVFCGSNSGNRAVFGDAAFDLGRELVKRIIDLVYGGGSVGLMGLISQTVYDGGCDVLGIIPTALLPIEAETETVQPTITSPTMVPLHPSANCSSLSDDHRSITTSLESRCNCCFYRKNQINNPEILFFAQTKGRNTWKKRREVKGSKGKRRH